MITSGFCSLIRQIYKQTSADGLRCGAENPLGKCEIFAQGNLKQVLDKFWLPGAGRMRSVDKNIQIPEQDIGIFGGNCIDHQCFAAERICFPKNLSGTYIT